MIVLPALILAATAASAAPAPTLAPALVKLAMPSFTARQSTISVKVDQPCVFSHPSSKMMPGGPGEDVLVFRAHDVGTVHLMMEYVRPWEQHTKPAKIAPFTVTVRK